MLLLYNREEEYARPSTSPCWHRGENGGIAWFGGHDLQKGGTWLGVNEHSILVAVTNRPKASLHTATRSRGLLCRDLLQYSSMQEAFATAEKMLKSDSYDGCNLLIASHDQAFLIEAGDELKTTKLEAGIHVFGNRGLHVNDDLRARHIEVELARLKRSSPASGIEDWGESLQNLSALHATEAAPAICLHSDTRGTVSSTMVALTSQPVGNLFQSTSGSPCEFDFHDYSPEFNSASAKNLSKPNQPRSETHYRIRLRGPWEFDLCNGANSQTGKVTMPANWESLAGDVSQEVRLTRWFHSPTNLDDSERVHVVIEGTSCCGEVLLNGHQLGSVLAADRLSFDVTRELQPRNSLQLVLQIPEWRSGKIWNEVALEIHSQSNVG